MLSGALAATAYISGGEVTESATLTAIPPTLLAASGATSAVDGATLGALAPAPLDVQGTGVADGDGGIVGVAPVVVSANESSATPAGAFLTGIAPTPLAPQVTAVGDEQADLIGVPPVTLTGTGTLSIIEQAQVVPVAVTSITALASTLSPKFKKQRSTPTVGEGVVTPTVGTGLATPLPPNIG
jgi:hypothetical protein